MKDMTHLLHGRGRYIRWWPGVVLLAILLLAGCGTTSGSNTAAATAPAATTAPTATTAPASSPTTASTSTAQVKVTEQSGKYGFVPTMLTVAAGTKVVWTNASDAPHTVTSDTGSTLASDTISPSSGTFSFTFTQPGTYTYHCSIHPYMKGTIVVTG